MEETSNVVGFAKRWLVGLVVLGPVITLLVVNPPLLGFIVVGLLILAVASWVCFVVGHFVGAWFGVWPVEPKSPSCVTAWEDRTGRRWKRPKPRERPDLYRGY